MKQSKKGFIRVGLIGTGMIGMLRARALKETRNLNLTAIADSQPERLREAARALSGVHVFSDGLELAQSDLVDAVVISTPPVSHESLGLACLAAGKHILCEKPLATSLEACQRLVDAAQQFGVCLATGFNLRYTPSAQLARELLDKGAIGELDHIRAFHGHPGGQEFKTHWICDSAVSGGGTLMDNGIHLIDLTRYFLGNVEHVTGYATNHTWEKNGCEDNGFLLLKNSEGRVATLQASWTEWRGYGYRLEIYGTHGFIRFGYPPLYLFQAGAVLVVG